MKRVHSKVERFLRNGYKTATPQDLRDSDKKLLLAYWETQGLELTSRQKITFMTNCDIAESITRARRELKKDYPASPKVDKQRFEQFKQYRQEYTPQYQARLA